MKDEPRYRLQEARKNAGFGSPSEAARAFPRDLNRNTLISHENGNRPISKKAAEKYGELFGVSAGWILFNDGEAKPIDDTLTEVSLSRVGMTAGIVAGVVEAGTFREVDEFDQSERQKVAIPRDEMFPDARQLLFDCSGDSMNDLKPRPILSGDRLVCIDYNDVEHLVELKSGMVVVVQRERDGGHFREWSVKQIELYPDRTEFHPRSTNPKHKPIVIQRDHDADNGVTVQVIGLVRRVMNEMPGF